MKLPKRLPHGPLTDLSPRLILDLMTPHWRGFMAAITDDDFPRPYVAGTTRHMVFDSAVRRALIVRLNYHRDGKWQFRLTHLGRDVRDLCAKWVRENAP